MRPWLVLLGVLAIAAFLVIDPIALARLSYICATGHCGVRPLWILLGALALVLISIANTLIRKRRQPIPVKRRRKKPTMRRPRKGQAGPIK